MTLNSNKSSRSRSRSKQRCGVIETKKHKGDSIGLRLQSNNSSLLTVGASNCTPTNNNNSSCD